MWNAVPTPKTLLSSDVQIVEGENDVPSGVKQHQWRKLQELQERRQKIGRGRQRQLEKLKNKIIKKALEACHESDDQATGSLTKAGKDEACHENAKPDRNDSKDIAKYMNANPQLKGLPPGRFDEKSVLERQLDQAITSGEHQVAEMISAEISRRQLAIETRNAIECRDYAKRKQEEEAAIHSKKKPRLNWGFDPKDRWERKGNM